VCSRLQVQLSSGKSTYIMPGDQIPYHHNGEDIVGTWGADFGFKLIAFARSETVREKWLSKGWQTCTVPIVDYAEGYAKVIWAGCVGHLAALVRWGEVVIVTRQATEVEERFFNHDRVPVDVAEGKMVLPSKGGDAWFE